ncbi:MAG: alpha/beta hydrolase [Syntrophales bacterium]|nr:alpha/beta hydrolase [Syntrophales bacterium]MCK9528189.1 alpha/beta hydrolase [Syntrophales bacterium]MDX9921336.1 alpha/beta hydrolase [Syntrophales bacterium]
MMNEDGLTRVFIHGLESSGGGTKGVFFKERYPGMIIRDYRGSLEERMGALRSLLAGKKGLVLVGSSYGGLMAALYACANPQAIHKLILLAPALALDEFREQCRGPLDFPVVVYHGSNDDVVLIEPVRKIAADRFRNLEYNVIDDDHSLRSRFKLLDWDRLLCYED